MRFVRALVVVLVAVGLAVSAPARPRSFVGCENRVIYTFDESGWYLNLYAQAGEITGTYGSHSAPVALSLPANGSELTGSAGLLTEEPHLTPGHSYVVRAWVNADLADEATPVRVFIGAFGLPLFEGRVYKHELGSGFQFVELGTFAVPDPNPGTMLIEIETNNGGISLVNASGRWGIDDIEIEEVIMETGKRIAVDALRDAFKTINGSPFRTSLQSRVYSRFNTPTSAPDIEMPWGVIQQVNSPSRYSEPGNNLDRTWIMTGLFFFKENMEDDPLNTSAQAACDDFEDDIADLIKSDPTLGGTVHRCNILDVDPIYGVTPDYAEVHVTIELEQQLEA